jgi:hypothetical protein
MGYNTEADLGNDDDDAFHWGWIRLGAEKNVDLSPYTSVNSELVTCSVSSIDCGGE